LIVAVWVVPVITQEAEPSDSEYVEYVQSFELSESVYVSYTQWVEEEYREYAGTSITQEEVTELTTMQGTSISKEMSVEEQQTKIGQVGSGLGGRSQA
jgi:hypothetical protein